MKKLLIVLGLALPLAGCETLSQPVRSKPSAETAIVASARLAIDEANAALTALNGVISSNVKEKVWTKAQAQSYLDRSRAAGRQVDAARDALRLGDPTSAENQAKLVRAAILALQREIAAQARRTP